MIRNVHERTIDSLASVLGPLLDELGGVKDRLWSSALWVPMVLDRPLSVGADGGHGSIRYQVTEYKPGRRVRFRFHRSTGIIGVHELSIEPLGDDHCRLRHVLLGRPRGVMQVLFPLVVGPIHNAVIEDLFDNAERESTGRVARPASHTPWVRLCTRLLKRRERSAGEQGTEVTR